MSREIRRVPPTWEHPRDDTGRYIPLYDQSYGDAALEWMDGLAQWEAGYDPDRATMQQEIPWTAHRKRGTSGQGGRCFYWESAGGPPEPEQYRDSWTPEQATHFQVYETVSDGTPVSPVLATLDAVREWCISKGYSPAAADGFVRDGWAPLMVSRVKDGKVEVYNDIESCGIPPKEPR
jgi:hypothetical protein